eukprot:evm.model.scf_778.4 EVM.evm.TU.scf_778.4   scf_778:35356-36108(-)
MNTEAIKATLTVPKLYRDCLRLAQYLGSKQGNTAALVSEIQATFRKNKGEKDPDKIEAMKEAAIRGLMNYTFHEATRMAKVGCNVVGYCVELDRIAVRRFVRRTILQATYPVLLPQQWTKGYPL